MTDLQRPPAVASWAPGSATGSRSAELSVLRGSLFAGVFLLGCTMTQQAPPSDAGVEAKSAPSDAAALCPDLGCATQVETSPVAWCPPQRQVVCACQTAFIANPPNCESAPVNPMPPTAEVLCCQAQ